MHRLEIMPGKPCFRRDGKPFFWLGDTAWLLLSAVTEQDAFDYLKDRSEKGFNVIQADLIHSLGGHGQRWDMQSREYWEHCDRVIDRAAELDLTMALLPSWGSLVKQGILNADNVERYGRFLAERYADRDNILWLLGGDIKPEGFEQIYARLAFLLKSASPDRLIGFHPFGRCSSSLWFDGADWLDFHMFQSGHRRYDQCSMGAWDDTSNSMSLYGEDNWRYVRHDLALGNRPVVDGEPSYEGILQGLHDETQPYWTAKDVRRYAYWSVFAGAAGHTYGDNSVMQFYDPSTGRKGAYGARDSWKDALGHPGAGQMRHLKQLIESVDYPSGRMADELLLSGQKERHERVAVFAGKDFLLAYSFLSHPFTLDTRAYRGKTLSLLDPETGLYTDPVPVTEDSFRFEPPAGTERDAVVVIK